MQDPKRGLKLSDVWLAPHLLGEVVLQYVERTASGKRSVQRERVAIWSAGGT